MIVVPLLPIKKVNEYREITKNKFKISKGGKRETS